MAPHKKAGNLEDLGACQSLVPNRLPPQVTRAKARTPVALSSGMLVDHAARVSRTAATLRSRRFREYMAVNSFCCKIAALDHRLKSNSYKFEFAAALSAP